MTFALRQEHAQPAPLVLFAGGKGGVGKSLVAMNTAVQLARDGLDVLLVDLDLGLADLAVLCDLTPQHTIEDALAGSVPLAECVVEGPAGIAFLPASSGSARMARLDAAQCAHLLEELTHVRAMYDIVVADGAAGIGPDLLAFTQAADRVVVVTTPEPTALTDAYGLIKALDARTRESGKEIATPEIFVNRAAGIDEAEEAWRRLSGACERFLSRRPRFAGWLAHSATVSESVARRRPFALDERAAALADRRALATLARRLHRLAPSLPGPLTTVR